MIAALAAAAFLLALGITRALVAWTPAALLDHPNDRSLHAAPMPRGGGIGIVVAVALVTGAQRAFGTLGPLFPEVLALGVGVAAVSLLDDLRHVPALVRLTVHAGAAAALIVLGGFAPVGIVAPGIVVPLAASAAFLFGVLFVVWFVNLYNFMDGMDGFAGGMAVIGFATYAALGFAAGDAAFAGFALVVAAAAAGFLVLNVPPARIFMGDVGSSMLGFLAAALALWAERDGLFPLWVSVLVFSPFVVDATVTLACRLVRGEAVWRAHRTHGYQRLVRAGWGHRRTVLWEYALMLACSASALLAMRSGLLVQWTVLVAWVLAYALAFRIVVWVERRAGVASGGEGTPLRAP